MHNNAPKMLQDSCDEREGLEGDPVTPLKGLPLSDPREREMAIWLRMKTLPR